MELNHERMLEENKLGAEESIQAPAVSREFERIFTCAKDEIGRRYSLEVIVQSVEGAEPGNLDGAAIFVNGTLDPQMRLFVLLHLFGHTVQWNTNAKDRELGLLVPEDPSEELLDAIREYEVKASGIGLKLLHEIGERDLDRWLTDLCDGDIRQILELYRTGAKLSWEEAFRPDSAPLLTAQEIPKFTPRVYERRYVF